MPKTREIIGLTGNIATGKSVVRRMLVNHGALGLDADAIAHRTLYPGGRAYQPVLDVFGKEILKPDGEIVFQDPERLEILESLVHPAVTADIQQRIERSTLPLIVIEAIKLLESPLIDLCDSVWVSQASAAHQLERLLQTRHMTEETAWQRINAQPPQSEKRMQADVVINTESAFRETWQQVHQALNDTIQSKYLKADPYVNIRLHHNIRISPAGTIPIEMLESFWQTAAGRERSDLFETLAFRTVLALADPTRIRTLLIINDWNFTSTLERVVVGQAGSPDLNEMLDAYQIASQTHQDEILIVPQAAMVALPGDVTLLRFGYENRRASEMVIPAWRQALERQAAEKVQPIWVKPITKPSGSGESY